MTTGNSSDRDVLQALLPARDMPTISVFYGLVVQMYFREHAPPHFHVKYGDYKAVVDIQRLEVTDGKLPRRAVNLVLDWAELHQSELMKDWDLCQALQQPEPIAPLE